MNATKWFATIMSCLTTLTLWDRGLLMDDSTLSLTHTFPSGERVKKAISYSLYGNMRGKKGLMKKRVKKKK